MAELQEQYQDILNTLDLDDIYSWEGHEFKKGNNGKLRGKCPFHESNSGTSLTVFPNNKKFHCAGCSFGGDALDYLHSLEIGRWEKNPNHNFEKRVKELSEKTGIALKEKTLKPEEVKQYQDLNKKRLILEEFYQQCHQELLKDTEQAKNARDYLLDRGLDEQSIKEFRLGLYPKFSELQMYLKSKGYDWEADIKPFKVINSQYSNYITIPWLDANKHPLTMYFRYVGKPHNDSPKTRALSGSGSKSHPLFLDRVLANSHKDLIAVEGVIDALVLQSLGETNVIAYVGAFFSNEQIETLKKKGIKSVTICHDPDEGGRNGSISSIKRLANAGIEPYVSPLLPDGLDPDQYVIREGVEQWKEFITQKVHGFTFLAQNLIQKFPIDTDEDKAKFLNECQKTIKPLVNIDSHKLELFFWKVIENNLNINNLNIMEVLNMNNINDNQLNEANIFTECNELSDQKLKEKSDNIKKRNQKIEQIKSLKLSQGQENEFLQDLAKDFNLNYKDMLSFYNLKDTPQSDINDAVLSQDFDDYFADTPDSIPYLIDNILPQTGVGIIYGQSGVCKTSLIYDLVKAISSGENWNDHPTNTGTVLIYQLEETKVTSRQRFKDIWDKTQVKSNIKFTQHWTFKDINKIEEDIIKRKPKLIVIDSLTEGNNGLNKNQNDVNYSQEFSRLRKLSEKYSCLFLITHHSNKQDGLRGSSAIIGDSDFIYKLTYKDENTRVLTVVKSRYDNNFTYTLKLDKNLNRWTCLQETKQNSGEDTDKCNTQKIKDYINNNPNRKFSVDDLVNNFDLQNRDSVKTQLNKMARDGEIDKDESNKGKPLYLSLNNNDPFQDDEDETVSLKANSDWDIDDLETANSEIYDYNTCLDN
jgi:DNA primase catalytic core